MWFYYSSILFEYADLKNTQILGHNNLITSWFVNGVGFVGEVILSRLMYIILCLMGTSFSYLEITIVV